MIAYKSNKVGHSHSIPLLTVTNWSSGEQKPDYCVVGGAHAFILRISSYFGLAPLRFTPHPNGFKISLSKPKCIYSYILITVLVILTILGIIAEINVGPEYAIYMTSRTRQIVFTCETLLIVITASAGVFGAPKRMKNLFRYMNSLTSVDRNVGGSKLLKNERKFYGFLLAMLPVSLILLVLNYSSLIYSSKKLDRLSDGMINSTGCYLVWLKIFLLEMQFVFAARSVRARIAAINDALAVAPRQVTHAVLDNPHLANRLRESIHRIATSYGIVCDVVQEINDSYGLLLVTIFGSYLLSLIVMTYALIMEIITSTYHLGNCIILTLWCAFKVLRTIVIVDSCHKTVQGGEKTELLVCRLMNDVNPEELLSVQLQLFSKQLMLQGITYSPLGMFTLDRPILTSVIGAITTYLVIIIQFQTYDK